MPSFLGLKVQTIAMSERTEENMEPRLLEISKAHANTSSGASFLRIPKGSFELKGPERRHTCFLYEPMH